MENVITLVPLTQGKYALIDGWGDKAITQHTWHFCHGYAGRRRKQADGPGPKTIFMHHVVLDVPDGMDADHQDRNKLNNQRSNLRPATRSQNKANVSMLSTNTSGFKGVNKGPPRGKPWVARITVGQKAKHIGCFNTPEEAAHAYDEAARETFGEFAFQNFP